MSHVYLYKPLLITVFRAPGTLCSILYDFFEWNLVLFTLFAVLASYLHFATTILCSFFCAEWWFFGVSFLVSRSSGWARIWLVALFIAFLHILTSCTCVLVSLPHGVILWTKYSKTCVKPPLSKRRKIGFQDQLSLNAGQKYCRMLQGNPWSILQYFRPSLSYHLSLRSLFCLFLSGRFTQLCLRFWY